MKIGGLFFGYGGLDLAVQTVLGGELAWVSEIDRGACKVIAHRFPGVPNIGDITTVDWASVEPVDVITGGSPCQDLSHAGARRGMTEGTRSNLWVSMREAIATIRPKYVVWENVRGAASAEADSDLVNQPGLLAGVRRRDGQPLLRALGRVVGDLSDLGYVGQVRGLRAADVGAPHGRFRYFILARDAASDDIGNDSIPTRRGQWRTPEPTGDADRDPLLPTPVADNSRGLPSSTTDYSSLPNAVCALLPTPAVNDMGEGKTVDHWDAWTETMKAKHGNGNGHGPSLAVEAQRLLPTPDANTGDRGPRSVEALEKGDRQVNLNDVPRLHWGQYAGAIHRWESLTRPAPAPTETGPKGNPRLSAAFSEWMMGLPAGWVTDVPGITRNEALRALGNGVVPQQCAAAFAEMLSWQVAA